MAQNDSSPTKTLNGKIYIQVGPEGVWHELKVTGGRSAAIGDAASDEIQRILNGGKLPPKDPNRPTYEIPQPKISKPSEPKQPLPKAPKGPKPIKIRPPRQQREYKPPKKHPRDNLTQFNPDYPHEKPLWPSFVQRMAMNKGTGISGAIRGSISDKAKYRTDRIKNAFLPENITRNLFGKTAGVLTAKAIGAGTERTQRVAGMSPYERWLWSKRYNKHTQENVANQQHDHNIKTGISGKTIRGGQTISADMASGESVLLLQQIETNTNTMMKIMSETYSETYGKHKYEALKATMFKTSKNHVDEHGNAIKETSKEKGRSTLNDLMMLGIMATIGVAIFKNKDKLAHAIEWISNLFGNDPSSTPNNVNPNNPPPTPKSSNIDPVTYEDSDARQTPRKNIFDAFGEMIKDTGKDIKDITTLVHKPIEAAHDKLMEGINWIVDQFRKMMADILEWIGTIKNPLTGNIIFPGAHDKADEIRKGIGEAQKQRRDTKSAQLRRNDREMVSDSLTQPTPSLMGKNPWQKGYGQGAFENFLGHDPSRAKSKVFGTTGNKASSAIMNYLMENYNLTKEQAAGIVSNLQHESSLDPTKNHPDPSAKHPDAHAYGLAQWQDPDRQRIFREKYGHEIYEAPASEQLDYMMWELNGPMKNVGDKLRKTTTASGASNVMAEFEKYGGWNEEKAWDNPNGKNDRAATAESFSKFYNTPDYAKNITPVSSQTSSVLEGVTNAHKDATGGASGGGVTQINNNVVNNNNSGGNGGKGGGGGGPSTAPVRNDDSTHRRAVDASWAAG